MLACNAVPGASSGNCDVDSTDGSSKVCTLRCAGDPAVSEGKRKACGPCKKSALRSWRSGGKWKQYWNNLCH